MHSEPTGSISKIGTIKYKADNPHLRGSGKKTGTMDEDKDVSSILTFTLTVLEM